jgi:hypothetical protein
MGDGDDERVAVTTYVPQYQKQTWADQAEVLGMSQSEFIRTMVQAGRHGFDIEPAEPRSPDVTPGVEGLEDRVIAVLSNEEFLSWDELVTALTEDLEDRLDETLGQLQDENRIRYSGRHGGYSLVNANER